MNWSYCHKTENINILFVINVCTSLHTKILGTISYLSLKQNYMTFENM